MGALTHDGEVLQSLPANASQINFDKTGTNLNSTQTEAAIKEVNTKVNTNTTDINQLKSGLTGLASEIITPSQIAYHLGHVAIDGAHDTYRIVELSESVNLTDYDFIVVGNSYYDGGQGNYGFAVVPTSVLLSIWSTDSGLSYLCTETKTSISVMYDSTAHAIRFYPRTTAPHGNYFFVGAIKLRTRS